jgi:oxygen-independent coproporphyrinogen III oxidase
MCDFSVSRIEILQRFEVRPARIEALFQAAAVEFGDMVRVTEDGFFIPDRARPLTRMIARAFDAYDDAKAQHSSAV